MFHVIYVTSIMDKLKIQQEDLKPIQKEYRDYGNTVDKINDLGIAYDSLMKERGESPTRRRGSASPTKRPGNLLFLLYICIFLHTYFS